MTSCLPRLHDVNGELSVWFFKDGVDHKFDVSVEALATFMQDGMDALARRIRKPARVAHPSDSDQPRPPV